MPDPFNALPAKLEPNTIERAFAARKTSKVLLPVSLREEQQARWNDDHSSLLQSMIASAAWAPFHKRANEIHMSDQLTSPMPWRFHVVSPAACTTLLAYLDSQSQVSTDPKWARAWQSKIKEMISACGVLVQATWLPEPDDLSDENTNSLMLIHQKNIEHIAAASSAIQSLLVSAQSHQWLSYWSSGGILRDSEVFNHLGMGATEQLLGSIFLNPQPHPGSRIVDGGLRERRGGLDQWVRWVE